MVQEILQLTVYGIISGCIFALSGIGLTLTFGILRFANFAHGDITTVGAFVALLFLTMARASGVPDGPLSPLSFGLAMIVAFAGAMIVTALLAALMDRLLYRRLRHSGPAILLISSIGVAFGLRAIVQFIWSPQPQYYIEEIQIAQEYLGVRIKSDQFFVVLITIVLVLALHFFLTGSKMGKAMRATSDSIELAKVSGINTDNVIFWTWLIGGGLAAAGGVLAGIENKFITPNLGWHMLIFVFASVILGGIGSPYGAMAGGLIIGISGELSTLVVGTEYKPAMAFLIMIAVLLLKPTGLFGDK